MNYKRKMNWPGKVLMLYLLAALPAQAEYGTADNKTEVGIAIASPVVGLSLRKVFNNRFTGAIVAGNGIQAQINYTRGNPLGGYYLLSVGSDDTVGLVRAGYGYKWRINNFSVHMEASLNIPYWDRELGGLADIGKIVYLFPIGLGMHYSF